MNTSHTSPNSYSKQFMAGSHGARGSCRFKSFFGISAGLVTFFLMLLLRSIRPTRFLPACFNVCRRTFRRFRRPRRSRMARLKLRFDSGSLIDELLDGVKSTGCLIGGGSHLFSLPNCRGVWLGQSDRYARRRGWKQHSSIGRHWLTGLGLVLLI